MESGNKRGGVEDGVLRGGRKGGGSFIRGVESRL
jgi:hypothetical protein